MSVTRPLISPARCCCCCCKRFESVKGLIDPVSIKSNLYAGASFNKKLFYTYVQQWKPEARVALVAVKTAGFKRHGVTSSPRRAQRGDRPFHRGVLSKQGKKRGKQNKMPNKTGVFTQRSPDETVPTDGKQQSSSAALHEGTQRCRRCSVKGISSAFTDATWKQPLHSCWDEESARLKLSSDIQNKEGSLSGRI